MDELLILRRELLDAVKNSEQKFRLMLAYVGFICIIATIGINFVFAFKYINVLKSIDNRLKNISEKHDKQDNEIFYAVARYNLHDSDCMYSASD